MRIKRYLLDHYLLGFLYIYTVQGMVSLMLQSAEALTTKWDESIEGQGGRIADIRVDEDLRGVSADVISRACFGSSYFKGKNIFSKLRTLQKIIANQSVLFGISTLGGYVNSSLSNFSFIFYFLFIE